MIEWLTNHTFFNEATRIAWDYAHSGSEYLHCVTPYCGPHHTKLRDKLRRDSRRAIAARKILISLPLVKLWACAPLPFVFPPFYPRALLYVCQKSLRDGGIRVVV